MSLVDLTNVKESGFQLLPSGTYRLRCMEAAVRDTKEGSGQYIKGKFLVTDMGEFHGKPIWHQFNIKNKNEQAQEIGLSQLKTFLACAGANTELLENVGDLCGLEADAVIKIKKDKGGIYDDKNEISYFKKAKIDSAALDESALM